MANDILTAERFYENEIANFDFNNYNSIGNSLVPVEDKKELVEQKVNNFSMLYGNFEDRLSLFIPVVGNVVKPIKLTEKEFRWKQSIKGAKLFKRKVIGRFKKVRAIAYYNLSVLLCETNIVKSVEEASLLMPKLVGVDFGYPYYQKLKFDVADEEHYRITSGGY